MLTRLLQELYNAIDTISKERVSRLIERHGGLGSAVVDPFNSATVSFVKDYL